jgi:hypothetical protein
MTIQFWKSSTAKRLSFHFLARIPNETRRALRRPGLGAATGVLRSASTTFVTVPDVVQSEDLRR